MPCIRIPNGFICGFEPVYRYKGFLFDIHREHGPSALRNDFQPRMRVLTGFWKAWQEWDALPEVERETFRVTEG